MTGTLLHVGTRKGLIVVDGAGDIIGLETALGLALDKLVHTGLITLNRLVEVMAVNPARIEGGGPNNVVPDHAVLRVNFRPADADAIGQQSHHHRLQGRQGDGQQEQADADGAG